MALPDRYAWLLKEPGPKMVVEALKLYGKGQMQPGWVEEANFVRGTPYANQEIDLYNDDSISWSGLAMAIAAARSAEGQPDLYPPNNYLAALAWTSWGEAIAEDKAMLGDVLVFVRSGGGHVAIYVGEDSGAFHILGANEPDAFNITRKAKSTLYAVRRPSYRNQPANVRKIFMGDDGPLCVNEQDATSDRS